MKRTVGSLGLSLVCMLASAPWLPVLSASVHSTNGGLQSLKADDGANIPIRSWIDNSKPPKAVLMCIHGLGLNSNSYSNFAKRMVLQGYAVYAIDIRGFGEWQRIPGGSTIDLRTSLADIADLLKMIRSTYPGTAVVIVGESMGGAVALSAASRYQDLADGVISAVPSGKRYEQKRTDLKVVEHALEGMHHKFDEGKQVVDQATQNPKLREVWLDSALDRSDFSASDLLHFQEFMDDNNKAVEKITTMPVLFLQGCEDKLVKATGTFDLFNKVASTDKMMVLFGDREHLILEDEQYSGGQSAVPYVHTWLVARKNQLEPVLVQPASQR